MRTKRGILLACSLLLAALTAGCGDNSDNANGVKTVHIYQFKVEISEALASLKTEFEKEHPNIKLEVQSVGGRTDYGASLRAKFSSGDEPDIFTIGGNNERDMWLEYLEDLSGEAWAKDVKPLAAEQMTIDGKLYGMPMNLEGYGLIYNKDLFKKAGITPFANGYQEWFVLGNHNVNVAFAQQPNPEAFIAGLTDGSKTFAGDPIFSKWIDLLDLTVEYGNKNSLSTDYNPQVTMVASGEAAMMQQGNWTQGQIDGIDPNLNLGILPMPIDDTPEDNDKLYVGVPSNSSSSQRSTALRAPKKITDTKTRDLVQDLRDPASSLASGNDVTLGVTGFTAINIDMSSKLSDAFPVYIGIIVILSLIILLLVFRSVIVPIKATVGFILSVLATFGLTTAVYQWGWLHSLFGFGTGGPLLSFMPILVTGILYGLAMDYQVFLVSSMREAYVHGRRGNDSVVHGYDLASRVVLAAGVIMVSVFAGFIFAPDAMIKQIGFALAFGILIDAFIIRMTLVPAIMAVFGDKAWWLPKWLDRLLPNLDVEGDKLIAMLHAEGEEKK